MKAVPPLYALSSARARQPAVLSDDEEIHVSANRDMTGSAVASMRAVSWWSTTLCACGLCLVGCGSLNPAFVTLLDPTGETGLSTLSNPPGHVVIKLINNAEVDERLLSFLESAEGGNLMLTDAQKQALRPRLRLSVRATFADGDTANIEFETGTRGLVDQAYLAEAIRAMRTTDLDNYVLRCDLRSIEIEPGADIEVYMPVEVTGYEMIETTNQAGAVIGVTFEARERTPPGFIPLRVDELDEDGNVRLWRNIEIRDVPSPANNPRCGSVIAIVVNGVLSVPFFDGSTPSYDRDDEQTEALIGGRFEFRVSIQ